MNRITTLCIILVISLFWPSARAHKECVNYSTECAKVKPNTNCSGSDGVDIFCPLACGKCIANTGICECNGMTLKDNSGNSLLCGTRIPKVFYSITSAILLQGLPIYC